MPNLNQITTWLDEYLQNHKISDNWSINGLQISRDNQDIKSIVMAVDASLKTFEQAKKQYSADLVIVHHGIIRPQAESLTNRHFQRIKFLIENNLALYGAHLPLDVHPKVGNNVQFAKLLNIQNIIPLSIHDGFDMGFIGDLPQPLSLDELNKKIETTLNSSNQVLAFGNKNIKTIAFCSGGSIGLLDDAINKKADVFIAGEVKHSSYLNSQDSKFNIIAAGHYATETLGVKALGEVLKQEFKIEVNFIDLPTGL